MPCHGSPICANRAATERTVDQEAELAECLAATRAVLRRRPERVLLRSAAGDPDLAALIHLCERDEVPVVADAALAGPYRAVTVIRETT